MDLCWDQVIHQTLLPPPPTRKALGTKLFATRIKILIGKECAWSLDHLFKSSWSLDFLRVKCRIGAARSWSFNFAVRNWPWSLYSALKKRLWLLDSILSRSQTVLNKTCNWLPLNQRSYRHPLACVHTRKTYSTTESQSTAPLPTTTKGATHPTMTWQTVERDQRWTMFDHLAGPKTTSHI